MSSSILLPSLATKVYDMFEKTGVTAISSASVISLLAILILLVFGKVKGAYPRTHVLAYYLSLLAANTMQSSGTAMNIRWVIQGQISADSFCSFQGAIKQMGNVSTAIWAFMIALHLFSIIFLRIPFSKLGLAATLVFGWTIAAVIVTVGPAAIETVDKGPYFGISGNWCWITDNYPKEQTYLEYLFELLSAGLSFLLYVTTLLRVRGNIFYSNRWHLRFVPAGESWQLNIGRDLLDSAMLKAAKSIVWFPIVYTIILFPISVTRLIEFAGGHVPDWAPIVTDVLFNLTGFFNVILFVITRKHFDIEEEGLPEYTTQRKERSLSFQATGGVQPFPLGDEASSPRNPPHNLLLSDPKAQPLPESRVYKFPIPGSKAFQLPMPVHTRSSRRFSVSTFSSVNSTTPLTGLNRTISRMFTKRRK